MPLVHAFDLVVAIYGCAMGASTLLQARRVHRRRASEDVSVPMLVVIIVGSCLWLSYGLVHGDPVVIVANVVGVCSSALTLAIVWRYRVARPELTVGAHALDALDALLLDPEPEPAVLQRAAD